jgi:hypothetical protein
LGNLNAGVQKVPALTFAQLIARHRLDGKGVSVTGYFDAKELILVGERASEEHSVAIDLTKSQARALKENGQYKSGYVRVVGKFEYVGEGSSCWLDYFCLSRLSRWLSHANY